MAGKTIPGLGMRSFNTSLMGVLKGVTEYYGLDHSDAWLFGGSGHAFLINIHDQLCPSGPYCWNPQTFRGLVGNLGINMRELGFYHSESPAGERERVEEALRENIDAGIPCSLLNMENQMVAGYDDEHLMLLKPWPKADLPITPGTLTYGTWEEFGEEVHVDFYAFTRADGMDEVTTVKESLEWAVDMVRNPLGHTGEGYSVGLEAYDAWAGAVEAGHGSSHGNWWNGTVWSECRRMASEYFSEISRGDEGEVAEIAGELVAPYRKLSELIGSAARKEGPSEEKIQALGEAREIEGNCTDRVEELLQAL